MRVSPFLVRLQLEKIKKIGTFEVFHTGRRTIPIVRLVSQSMEDSRFYGRAMIEQQQGKIIPSHTNSAKGNEHIPHPDKLVGHVFPQSKYNITPQAVALYNLAIGAARNEPTDPKQLSFVYENSEGILTIGPNNPREFT